MNKSGTSQSNIVRIHANLETGYLKPKATNIKFGKDILELLSSSMYVDPLTIFREYIQNSVDAIDDAVQQGVLKNHTKGKVNVVLDHIDRRIIIRDNGVGVSSKTFEEQLISFGASKKRNTDARGFRGVGRLAGLGYCQELIFRSKAPGSSKVNELRWDCRLLKKLINDANYHGELKDLVRKIATTRSLNPKEYPNHFFEVEIIKPIRLGKDILLNEGMINDYISQICPVPFNPVFKFRDQIHEIFKSHKAKIKEYFIYLNESDEPIYRPHKNKIQYGDDKFGKAEEIVPINIQSVSGQLAAVGWLLHHDYQGAIPNNQQIRGLRARVGNIQIGGSRFFADIFNEDRFNSWSIGEIHVLDNQITPNGRRDNFEQNTHYSNLQIHLAPYANQISVLCRSKSQTRNRIKSFELIELKALEEIDVLKQNAVSRSSYEFIKRETSTQISELKNLTEYYLFNKGVKRELVSRLGSLERKFARTLTIKSKKSYFDKLPKIKQSIYKEVFGLIYECSGNRAVAHGLVEKILSKLSR